MYVLSFNYLLHSIFVWLRYAQVMLKLEKTREKTLLVFRNGKAMLLYYIIN